MNLLRQITNIQQDQIRKIETEDDNTREWIISTERKDGHNSVIPLKAWDLRDFNKVGAFYYQHQTGAGMFTDANPDNALGPATAYFEGSNLVGRGTFEPEELNPLAQKIKGKMDFGTLKSVSVGFRSLGHHWGNERDMEDPTVLYFDTVELKEFSIVHIASNPDAMKRFLEPMDHFMMEELKNHTSKGFQKDFSKKLRMQYEHNKHFII